MQVLKKTNGIDLKAKGTALHGNAVITLKDATTGRITEQIEHKNFFTKAIDSAYNGCPFGLDSLMKMGESVFCDDRSDKLNYKFGDIYKSLLGGIICFPESLGNSVDDYFPSFTENFPTAYASMADYSITDSRQGTYDGVSSGKIANGYRYVYDWGSSGGNGRISAIALSHKNSFEYFKNPINMLYPKVSTQDYGRGYYGRVIANPSGDKGVVTMTDKYLICINEDGNAHRNIECHELPCFNIGLTNRYDGVTINDGSYKWAINLYEHGFNAIVIWQIYEGFLWGISKGDTGTSDVSFAKIDIETGELTVISKTWTIPNATNAARGVALKNGYFYIGQTTAGKIYKCNMDNVADVTEIDCGAVANCGLYTTDSTPYIFGTNIIINDDTVITHTSNNPIAATTINSSYPVYQNGVWIISSNGWSQYLAAQMLTTYCATKNNLESPITKTADKQMIITYTVTQE